MTHKFHEAKHDFADLESVNEVSADVPKMIERKQQVVEGLTSGVAARTGNGVAIQGSGRLRELLGRIYAPVALSKYCKRPT